MRVWASGKSALSAFTLLYMSGRTCYACDSPCIEISNGVAAVYALQWTDNCKFSSLEKILIDDAFHSWAAFPEIYVLASYPTSLKSRGSEFTLEWAENMVSAKGLMMIDTHGCSDGAQGPLGSVVFEFAPDNGDAQDRFREYTEGIDPPYTANEVNYFTGGEWLYFSPTGIGDKFSLHTCSFVLGNYCNSWSGQGSWNSMAFVGYNAAVECARAKPIATSILVGLECDENNLGDVTIGSQILSEWRSEANVLLSSRGDDSTVNCECGSLAPRFSRSGAFADTVWVMLGDDGESRLEVRGYKSISEWPDGGVCLGQESTVAGEHFYSESGIDGAQYPILAWAVVGVQGRRYFSEPIRWTSKPKDWSAIVHVSNSGKARRANPEARQVWIGKGGEILSERPNDECQSNPNDGAEVGLYWVDPTLPAVERDNLINLSRPSPFANPTWTTDDINLYTGDGSVGSQQIAANMLREANADYNDWCAAHPGECAKLYPTTPVFGIVGDPVTSSLEVGAFSDEMCSPTCTEPGQGAQLQGDPLEDLPVYWVPAQSIQEMTHLSDSADRYQFWTSHYRGLFFVGDRRAQTGERLEEPLGVLAAMENTLHGMGEPVYTILKSSDYSGATGPTAAKRDALVGEVNAGVSTLIGFEGSLVTYPFLWAGGFFWNEEEAPPPNRWVQMMTRPQSTVAMLFGCEMGDLYRHRSGAMRSIVRDAIVAPYGKTTMPFVMASGGTWDFHNYLWAEVLASELEEAPAGTPWPRIVFNAKRRALEEYPFMLPTLRTVAALGTMVRKHADSATDLPEPIEKRSPVERIELRSMRLTYGQVQLLVKMPHADIASLRVYDVRGRFVTTLWDGNMDAGERMIAWSGSKMNGDRVRSGVYFVRVQSERNGSATTKVVIGH